MSFKKQKAKLKLNHYDLYSIVDIGWGFTFKFLILNFNKTF
jgi:hypothetical protein